MSKPAILAITAVAALFGAAAAVAEPLLGKGTRELSVHVDLDFEGPVGDTIAADAGFGWFVRDGLLLRATASYAILEDVAAEDSDYRTSELGVAAEFHFLRERRFVPYFGLGAGWRSTEFADVTRRGLTYGPRAGLKLFVADNVALDFEVVYRAGGDDVFVNDFVVENTDLSTAIGLRVCF